jgi:hypothetical protein
MEVFISVFLNGKLELLPSKNSAHCLHEIKYALFLHRFLREAFQKADMTGLSSREIGTGSSPVKNLEVI